METIQKFSQFSRKLIQFFRVQVTIENIYELHDLKQRVTSIVVTRKRTVISDVSL